MAEKEWYFNHDGRQSAPTPETALKQMVASGTVRATDLVWTEGMATWSPAGTIPALGGAAPAPAPAPPPLPKAPLAYASPQPPPFDDIGQNAGMRMLLPVGRSGLAIAAGYLGLFSLIPFFAPIALIVSIIAIVQLRRNPQLHGMGRAIFGLVMGILGTGFIIVVIVTLAMGR